VHEQQQSLQPASCSIEPSAVSASDLIALRQEMMAFMHKLAAQLQQQPAGLGAQSTAPSSLLPTESLPTAPPMESTAESGGDDDEVARETETTMQSNGGRVGDRVGGRGGASAMRGGMPTFRGASRGSLAGGRVTEFVADVVPEHEPVVAALAADASASPLTSSQ
jgi:septal ring-binding cell division protein DamX